MFFAIDMPSKKLQSLCFLLLLCAISSCRAQNHSSCPPSSCGNIQEIRYPFRLKGDPQYCGRSNFELDCKENRTIITFKSKKYYYVKAISYDNYTIRLVDPGLEQGNNCSSPIYNIAYNDFPSVFSSIKSGKVANGFISLNTYIDYLNCRSPVNTSRYISTSFCSNSLGSSNTKVYSYVALGDGNMLSDFEENCGVEKVAWASVQGPIAAENTTLAGINGGLGYGFELSWEDVLCDVCRERKETCIIVDSKVSCRHYCYEDTPLEERSFRCKLEYYWPFIFFFGGGSIVLLEGVRFLCGILFVALLVRYQWKRRHLSSDGTIEDFHRKREKTDTEDESC